MKASFLLLLLSMLGVLHGSSLKGPVKRPVQGPVKGPIVQGPGQEPVPQPMRTGVEYQYRYTGRVASGITDVRHQFSAAGIQADVTMQVEEHFATVQFSNVEVGDFHDDFTCDMNLPLPIEYHRLEEGVELLEKPFRVNINGSKVIESLEVPGNEPAWITNIRKAVMNIFRITPFGVKNEDEFNPDFGLREETMAGTCTNWYTVIKLSELEAFKENHERNQIIEEDVQRESPASSARVTSKGGCTGGTKGRKGSKKGTKTGGGACPPSPPETSPLTRITDTLWHVIRSLDLEDCEHIVSMKGHINCDTEELISRSSVGNYLIRGAKNYMRIEKAVVEGAITVFTQKDLKEHLDTFTNQTLELKAVRRIVDPLTIDYDVIRTFSVWHYEVEYSVIDQKVDGVQPILEQILTGVELTEETATEIKRIVNTLIEDLSAHLPRNPTHHNDLVGEMSHVVDALSILNYQQLEELYNQYVSENHEHLQYNNMKLYILKQAMISAGTDPAINFLLHKMTEEDFRQQFGEIVYNFFSNIDTTIKSRSYINKIMNTIMQITWGHDEMGEKSIALMSFSKLVYEMCTSSNENRCDFWDLPCKQDHICPIDSLIDTYIPYLQEGLEDEESSLWQRLIYLQALGSLGIPHTISILEPYILGTKETYKVFRKTAIWSLNRLNLPETVRGKVFELLMPVFENVAEYHEVRNIAFLVMATWETSLSFWHQMAMSTWHEPSSKVASFISTTIKTTAHMHGYDEMAKVASRVEHLTKPAAPSSISHSINSYALEYLYSNELGRPLNFAWMASTGEDALIPSHVYFRLKTSTFLGFTHDLWMYLGHSGGDAMLMKLLEAMYKKQAKKPVDASNVEIVMEMFDELKEHIKFEADTEHSEHTIMLMVDNVFRAIYFPDGGNDWSTWMYAKHWYFMPHYYRYVDGYLAVPTELGVPFIAKHTAQYAWSHGSRMMSSGDITLDASKMFTVEAKTLIPWSKKFAVGTGSENLISILLPLKVHIRPHESINEVEIEILSSTNDKVKLIDAHNLPFTVQYGAFPTIVHYNDNECITVKETDEYLYTRKTQALPSFLGLWIESEWNGDIQFPFYLRSLYKGELNLFTPTLKAWNYHILHDPEASTTKSLLIIITIVITEETRGTTKCDQQQEGFGQQSQSPTDCDYTQQSSSGGSQQFGDVDVFDTFGTQTETRGERLIQLQQQVLQGTKGVIRSISIDFDLRGTSTQKYEAVLHLGTGTTKSSTKLHFSWKKHVPEGTLGVAHTTCLNVELIKPHILPFASIEDVLNTNFHATIKADVFDGINCDQSPVLKIQGIMDVSQEQLNDARRKLTEEQCGSASDFHPIDLITSPIYDHINFKAQWTEEFPIELKNFTYFIYDMHRGLRFPNNEYDYTVTNTYHSVEIDATKAIKTHLWTTHITKPTEVSIIENTKSPYLFDVIASPAHVKETLLYDFLNGRKHQACVIDHHKIRTFDGLEIPYESDSCWNVLVMDTTKHNYRSIEVRFHDDQWEARILIPNQGLQLDLTKTSLSVNGEPYSGQSGDDDTFSYEKLDDGIILTMPFLTDAVLKITDKVYYLEDQMFRSWLGGLCGNLDGEISAEMVGPKGCVYTDPELFVKSWKNSGSGCRGFAYRGIRRTVEAYQETCLHKSYVSTGVLHPNMLNDCYDWEHHERIEDNYICKALAPTPKCKSGCHGIRFYTNSFEYDCKLADGQSIAGAHECYSSSFDIIYPGNCIPGPVDFGGVEVH